ncbi:hypothetical protein [Nonlabens agnitus]|uniref:Uncharacterized protein n=1 Tax=Nonlabens agnitus TaxID=870484 RepID=A0A2S9WSR0_9FLAO|nr:hypothetical protein [Nonlabens agnitus]PRP66489.1 hypothetical protein BST86_04960 [Nonlabens agnitus]
MNFGTNLIEDHKNEFLLTEVVPLKILKGYSYRAIGRINSTGELNGVLFFNRLPNESFEKKMILDVSDYSNSKTELVNKQELKDLTDSEAQADLGGFMFDIRIYDREKDAIEKLGNILNEKNTRTKNILNKLLGIRISKNGFGVKPYGDIDGVQDWLGLGQKRVQDPGKILDQI